MTINPKQKIAGCSILRIRDFVRSYSDQEFDLKMAAKTLEIDAAKAAAIVEWLKANEYITRVESSAKGRWTSTARGAAFVNSSARKKISRRTADRLLNQLVGRAKEANEAKEFAYRVERIVVFGSYLGTAPTLSDLDVAVELKRAAPDVAAQLKLEAERVRVARASGRRMRNLTETIYWPQQEVFRFLKGRSPSYHFIPPTDGILQTAARKVVFDAAAQSPSKPRSH
jgi:predicted nucleotidyltransferase